MVGRLLVLVFMCCLFVDWKLEDVLDIVIGFIFCVFGMVGGIFCMLLLLLFEEVNIFVNELSCFVGVVMVIFILDELLLFFCMILGFCFLYCFVGFFFVFWELLGKGRLLYKRSKLCNICIFFVLFNFVILYIDKFLSGWLIII